MKAAELGIELGLAGARAGPRGPEAPRARRLPLRGRRRLARAVDAGRGRRRAGRRLGDLFRIESFRVITDWRADDGAEARRPTPRSSTPGPSPESSRPRRRSRCTSATSASWRPPRATGRSTRSTRRSGSPSGRTSASSQRAPHRLPGAGPRHGKGDGSGDPGAPRHRRRRRQLVDDRGLGEHHRGLLAGARRRHRLRPGAGGRGRRGRGRKGREETEPEHRADLASVEAVP